MIRDGCLPLAQARTIQKVANSSGFQVYVDFAIREFLAQHPGTAGPQAGAALGGLWRAAIGTS